MSSGALPQIVLGRDPSCDVVIEHPTVSSRHARLIRAKRGFLLEDLGSTNGTFVAGDRVQQAKVATGDDVRLGDVTLAWSDPAIVSFVRGSAGSGTVVLSAKNTVPTGKARTLIYFLVGAGVGGLVLVAALLTMALRDRHRTSASASSGGGLLPGLPATEAPGDATPLGAERASRIAAAMDSTASGTRNAAVKIAAGEEGPFHVEQIARIWTHVRGRWQYVNDPQGSEYFAKASETIENDFAGDCDDFAIVLASMILAVGGEARVVVMNAPEGGHAYAEACVRMDPTEVASRLSAYYRRKWDPYLGRQRVTRIRYRTTEACPVWLNLDWSAGVPGGPYSNEQWAVAVTQDGRAESLSPGVSDVPDAGTVLAPRRAR